MRAAWLWLAAAMVLILGGGLLAHAVQTAGGTAVAEVQFAGDRRTRIAGLLYTPSSATAERPAPAVLLSHGYINTREMQSAFAIELARRGFVVLAMDMPGHGHSDGVVGANDFGGAVALRYLKSLPQVDPANIGLAGHSLGGGPVVGAAASDPDGYKASALVGSTPAIGAVFGSQAQAELRNLSVVFGAYDEFAPLMWQVEKGAGIARSKALMDLFGTAEPVVEGRLYGDPAAGTARVLHVPPITHPWEHFSAAGVGPVVDWFQQRLEGEAAPRPPGEQIWFWKEVGTLIAFVGFVMLLLATFRLLLAAPWLSAMSAPGEPVRECRDRRWLLAFVLTAAVPAITFFPLMKLGMLFFPNRVFPQWVANQLVVWALANALITFVLAVFLKGGRPSFRADWPRSVAIALGTLGAGYAALLLADALFEIDFRFWVLALKAPDARQAVAAAAYAPLWILFFLVALRALNANLALKGQGALAQSATYALALSLGFVLLLTVQYVSLFATRVLAIPSEPLNTIIAIQFVPLLAIVGVIAALTWRWTNAYLPGALICGLLVAWYVSAGTAMHWSPGFQLPMPGR
jgi:poly(3-hydroxybutyrate) depolymerase